MTIDNIKTNNRIINFDLLKSLIMFFIIIWHSIVHGLNISSKDYIPINTDTPTAILNHFGICFLMYLTAVAVNCFVLITGYFMINYNKSICPRLFKIWGITSLYSLLISLIFYILDLAPSNLISVILTAFPIYNGEYWFITKYLGLVLLIPYLVKLESKTTQKEFLGGIILLSFLNLYIPPFLNYGNTYSGPYGILLFINLFYIGGYIKKYNPLSKKHKIGYYFLTLILLLTTIDFSTNIYNHTINNQTVYLNIDNKMTNNGTTFISSLLLFLYFKNKNFNNKSSLTKFGIAIAPYSFGVYLIHDNREIRNFIWEKLNLTSFYESPYLILIILTYSVFIYCFCIFIDHIRKKISKLLHINKLIENCFEKINIYLVQK